MQWQWAVHSPILWMLITFTHGLTHVFLSSIRCSEKSNFLQEQISIRKQGIFWNPTRRIYWLPFPWWTIRSTLRCKRRWNTIQMKECWSVSKAQGWGRVTATSVTTGAGEGRSHVCDYRWKGFVAMSEIQGDRKEFFKWERKPRSKSTLNIIQLYYGDKYPLTL